MSLRAYNTANQRIIKTYGGVTTWYIRDAQGNVMGIYDNTHGNINWLNNPEHTEPPFRSKVSRRSGETEPPKKGDQTRRFRAK